MIILALFSTIVFDDAAAASSPSSSPPASSLSASQTQMHLQRCGFVLPKAERMNSDDEEEASDNNNKLDYSIFDGRSCIRSLPSDLKQKLFTTPPTLTKAATAIILLLSGYIDASHEVVLGVTPTNVDDAEYAATHRGQTTWTTDHPFTDVDDLVHSLIHRKEGHAIGEGGYSGYDNAKYWAAGGPKLCERSLTTNHPVYQSLASFAKQRAPMCVDAGVVTTADVSHKIIQGGGKERTVTVPKDCWDPFCFIDLCRHYGHDNALLNAEIRMLEEREIDLILEHEVKNIH